MNHYVESDCAVIYRTKELFGEGSNMASGFPILYEGKIYHSTEALYQLTRFPGLTETRLAPGAPTLIERVNVKNAMMAKMCSKPFRHLTRPDWMDVRVPIMESVLRFKIDQHPTAMGAFFDMTEDMPIVEKSRRDAFWGAKSDQKGNLIGENVLGLLWMLLREEVRTGIFHAEVTLTL